MTGMTGTTGSGGVRRTGTCGGADPEMSLICGRSMAR